MNTNQRPSSVSNFLLLSLGYVAIRFILGLVRTRLLTEVLPKDLYGSLTLAAMTVTFTAIILSVGGFEFLVRRLPGLSAQEQKSWLQLLLRKLALPGWILTGAVVVAGRLAGFGSSVTWIDLLLLWLALGFTSWLLYRTFYFLGCGRLVPVRVVQLCQHDLWFFSIAIAGYLSCHSLTVMLILWTLWLGALSLLVLMRTGTIRVAPAPGQSIKEALSFGFPLWPMIAGDIVFRIADRYLLLNYQNMAVVADYTLCMNIAMIAYIVGASLMDLHIPSLNAARNQIPESKITSPSMEMKRIFCVMLRQILAIGISATLALIFFSHEILSILSGPAYHTAAPLLPWTALVPFVFLMLSAAGRGLLTMDRPRLVGGSTMIAAVFNVFLSMLFISRWGAVGAALSITTSLSLLLLVLGWELDFRKWIDLPSLRPGSLAGMTVIVVFCFFAINHVMPNFGPWIKLGAGGAGAALTLWLMGVVRPSDFHVKKMDVPNLSETEF